MRRPIGQLYGIPNDIRYAFSDRSARAPTRRSSVQFAPIEALTLTADYTYARDGAHRRSRRADHLAAAQRLRPHRVRHGQRGCHAPGACTRYTAPARTSVTSSSIANRRTRSELDRLQRDWDVDRQLQPRRRLPRLEAASSLPDDRITGGSETPFSLAGKVPSTLHSGRCGRPAARTSGRRVPFNDGLPLATRTLFPTTAASRHWRQLDYTFRRRAWVRRYCASTIRTRTTDIKQARLDGKFKFEDPAAVRLRCRNPFDGMSSARLRELQ